jgi:hypothetical protein
LGFRVDFAELAGEATNIEERVDHASGDERLGALADGFLFPQSEQNVDGSGRLLRERHWIHSGKPTRFAGSNVRPLLRCE